MDEITKPEVIETVPESTKQLECLESPNELTLAVKPGTGQVIYDEPDIFQEKESVSSKPARHHLVTQVLCMDRVINISRARKEITVKNFSSSEQMILKFEELPDFLKDLYEIFKSYV